MMDAGFDLARNDDDYGPDDRAVEQDGADPVRLDPAYLVSKGICAHDHSDPRSRSFLLLRTHIVNDFHASGGRVMAVTSTQPGNGKSFVAANLAIALSRVQPVVLVDLDLAKPSLAGNLGLTVQAGIDDYLVGAAPLEACRQKIDDLRLSVFPVRQPRLCPAGLLSGERFDALFPRAADRADSPIFVIDTPPTLAIDEILAIAGKADGVLMVVEEGKTHADELLEAMALLEPRPIVGTVLNKSIGSLFRRRSGNYYYYGDRSSSPKIRS